MAEAVKHGDLLVLGWHIPLLLLILVALGLVVELVFHLLHSYLHRRKKYALVEVVQQVKNELLLVGFVSLFLSVFGEMLAKVCIPDNGDADAALGEEGYTSTRRLQAGGGGFRCPDGEAQMWPLSLQHKAHIFIFCTAIAHIFYTCVMILAAKLVVNQWVAWEVRCQEDPMPDDTEPTGRLARFKHVMRQQLRQSRPWKKFLLAPLLAMFGADFETYRHIRALIIVELPLWPAPVPLLKDLKSQNVHARFVDALEYEMADITRVNWWLWLAFVGFLAIPNAMDYVIWAMVLAAALALMSACAQLVYCMAMLRKTSTRRLKQVAQRNLTVADQNIWRNETGAWRWCSCFPCMDPKRAESNIGQSAGSDARELKRGVLMDEFHSNAVLEKASFFRMQQLSVSSRKRLPSMSTGPEEEEESASPRIGAAGASSQAKLETGGGKIDVEAGSQCQESPRKSICKQISDKLRHCFKSKDCHAEVSPEGVQDPTGTDQHHGSWWTDMTEALFWNQRDLSLQNAVERFRDEYPQPLLHTNANTHLWFKSLTLTLRLLQVVFFENAFSIAISSYSLVNLYSYEHGYLTGLPDNRIFEGYSEAALVIACELLMLVFSSVYVLPMFALIAPLSSQCSAHVFKRGMDTLQFQHDLGSMGSQQVDVAVHRLETLRLHTLSTTREQRSALSLARAPIVAAVASARLARMASLCSSITSRQALGGVFGRTPQVGVQPYHVTIAMDSSVEAVKPAEVKAPPCCD